jgi:asparagine synthase (glutamine-hydrolysing)
MCGIAGFLGSFPRSEDRINQTLKRMGRRGPDIQKAKIVPLVGKGAMQLLHSRLSILDLDPRSNQPMERENCHLIFNGEIYNYIELREELRKRGRGFSTSSDTEVLLEAYLEFGEGCVERLEGMWAFAIWDGRRNTLFLSRDRFGEKPLYFAERPEGFYFASETGILRTLADWKPAVNMNQIRRYLALGYKSLYKHGEGFWQGIRELPSGHSAVLSPGKNLRCWRYWDPVPPPIRDRPRNEILEEIRQALLKSVRIRLRSDVPLAFCLSGGVDSAALVSIAVKEFNCQATAFSILDKDPRYDESDNMRATVEDLKIPWNTIQLRTEGSLERLRDLVAYHDAPVATMTYLVHSMISEEIHRGGFKVAFSGTSADELFTGYYDHYILHLAEMKNAGGDREWRKAWKTHILPTVRNPCFQDADLYVKNPHARDHIYDHQDLFRSTLREPWQESFREDDYGQTLLRNRMLNELFTENTPVALHEDDLNSMRYSVENRSPYLDTELFKAAYTIPTGELIRDGHAKSVLRDAVRGILNDQVRLDRRKKGFNASLNSLFPMKNPDFRRFLQDHTSPLAELVEWKVIEPWLDVDPAPNHIGKFLFNLINLRLFFEVAN